jgi:hypothetical protein
MHMEMNKSGHGSPVKIAREESPVKNHP